MSLSHWFQIHYRRVLFFLIMVLCILLAAFGIAKARDFYRAPGSDFFSFWLASHLLVTGESPYNPDAWLAGHEFYGGMQTSTATVRAYGYPLSLAVLGIPLGFLSLEVAAVLATAASILGVIFSFQLALSSGRMENELKYTLPAIAGIFLFRPVSVTLYLGQIDTIILFVMVLCLWLWQRKKWFWGGFLLAFTVLKPNIGPPLLFFIGIWLLYQRKWNAIAGMGLAAGVLYLLGWIFDPLWVQHWLAALSGFVENRRIFTPTIWGFSYWITNGSESLMNIISVALILILSIGLLLMLLRIKDDQPQIAVGAAIPIILMVMPYLWVYSQCALVLPLLLIWQKMYEARSRYLFTSGFLLLIGLFSFILVLVAISIGTDVNTIFIPALTLGLFYSFFIQRIVSGHIAVT